VCGGASWPGIKTANRADLRTEQNCERCEAIRREARWQSSTDGVWLALEDFGTFQPWRRGTERLVAAQNRMPQACGHTRRSRWHARTHAEPNVACMHACRSGRHTCAWTTHMCKDRLMGEQRSDYERGNASKQTAVSEERAWPSVGRYCTGHAHRCSGGGVMCLREFVVSYKTVSERRQTSTRRHLRLQHLPLIFVAMVSDGPAMNFDKSPRKWTRGQVRL
jgi:hypothetical protein